MTQFYLFRYAKKVYVSDNVPILNPQTQLLVNERLDICSLLLDRFNSVFTSPNINMIVHDPVSFSSCQSINPDECLTDIEITEPIIIDSIHEFSSTSAAGPDGVPSSLILDCAAELAPVLKLPQYLNQVPKHPKVTKCQYHSLLPLLKKIRSWFLD